MSEPENIKAAHAFFEAWNAGDLRKARYTMPTTLWQKGPAQPAR